jgi:tetratricopeptide (TPR) repeat protein
LAVSLKRRGDTTEALTELAQCLRLRPNDSEALALEKTAWSEPETQPPAGQNAGATADRTTDPLERVARNFDAVAFRQAATMLDQVGESRLAALTPRKRAETLASQAQDYLNRGLLLEAERLYQTAVAIDNSVAEAHTGLAEVRERTGDAEAARKEARESLKLTPSVDAYMVLGRLDLAGGKLEEADKEAGEALKLAPMDRAAGELRRQVEAREAQKK